ncbi:MAG: chemotaxis protein CheW [Bacteroidetes bacterium]|nr:chemotaxis protein CheW [Bacteroidota bacterium]
MSAQYQKQIDDLAEVMQMLANVSPADQDLIAQTGAKLEDAIEGFGDSTQLSRLIELAWEGIKHLYSKDTFFMTVKMATLQAVNTIREYALTNGDMEVREFERACENLIKALKGDAESADKIIELPTETTTVDTDTIPVTPVSKPVEPVTLDDVNAAFMKLDATSLTPDLLRNFYNLLETAADQQENELGQILQEAVVALTEAPDPETMIASVGHKLEEASEAKMMLEFVAESQATAVDDSGSQPEKGASDADGDPQQTTAESTSVTDVPETVATEPEPVAAEPKTETPVNTPEIPPVASSSAKEKPAPQDEQPDAERTPDFEIPDDADIEMLQEFYTECSELIGIAEEALLDLENNPDDDELINQVFRAFHTIKGTAAFLGLMPISEFAHYVETVLMMVREDQLGYTNQCADMTLDSLDTIKLMVQEVPTLSPGKFLHIPPAYDSLITRLKYVEAHGEFGEADIHEIKSGDADQIPTSASVSNEKVASAPVSEQVEDSGEEDEMDDWSDAAPSSESKDVKPASTGNNAARSNGASKNGAQPKPESEGTVRVNTERLDRLIDMVGELVIAHSVVAQDGIVASDSDLLRKVTHSSKILRELQDISLKLRMVPLKSTFQKMNRLVRDLSRKAGKQVAFHTVGDDTEIDRNMVDVISEPLVHMLRNSLDHGVETPDQRLKVGKDSVANVYLRAYQQGGKVVIEIEDDGRGLNTEKIYAKALEKEIIEPNKNYTDTEIHNFIFLPGFSTADVVTDLSGRGVGMDVVRRSIDKLQGKVDVSSETGMGSMVSIELPFTLAITDGMLVRVGEQRFIIPTINIDMTFRPEESANFTILGNSENVMFRGSSIPVIRLHRMFNVVGAAEDISEGVLMVINSNRKKYALLIDEVLGQQHLVGKSINMPVKLQNISGGAILGDGRVGLILDTVALVN